MKKTILTTLASLVTVAAFSQGTVTFQNATSQPYPTAADRNVKWAASAASFNPALIAGANVSSNYAGVNLTGLRAALYYAPGTVTDANWQQVNLAATGGAATFKNSTSATAGSWFGGARTLDTLASSGGAASLLVVVWNSTLSSDPFSAAAQGGLWGRSAVFSYTTPTSGTPAPAEFLPNNLASFTVGYTAVPEPTSMALAGLGAASLLIFRRRK
jgi:hypothetical protein